MTARLEATAPEATIELRFLGRFAIHSGGMWHAAPPPKKGGWLIQYLGTYPRRVASRDELAAAFWPGLAHEEVGHRIHLAASGARAFLRRLYGGIDALEFVGSGYSWSPRVRIVSDAERLLAAGRNATLDDLLAAADLYGGEYLSGEVADWLQPTRIKLASAHASVLERLTEQLLRAGENAAALSFGLDLVDSERGHEGAARLVMRCFAALGQPLRAMEQFRMLEAHLAEQLGVEPAIETISLRDEIVFGGARAS